MNSNKSNKEKNDHITCAHLHPNNESLFAFGTNRGQLSIVDSRVSISSPNTLSFACEKVENHFASEIIKQYTSTCFLNDSKKIVTRDLISVKVWDMCNNR